MLYDKFFEGIGRIKAYAQATILDLLQYVPQIQAMTRNTGSQESDDNQTSSFARSASEAAASVFMGKRSPSRKAD